MRKLYCLFLLLILSAVMLNSCKKDEYKTVTGIYLDKTTLSLVVGEFETLDFYVYTTNNDRNKTIKWKSSNANATVDENGKITAIAEGTAVITAKAEDKINTCTVTIKNVPDGAVVVNGVAWATRNLDEPGTFAANQYSSGKLYQWNRKTTEWTTGYDTNTDYWEDVNNPSPEGWTLPTGKDYLRLTDESKVRREWVIHEDMRGLMFTDIETRNSIFLPANGWIEAKDGIHYDFELCKYFSTFYWCDFRHYALRGYSSIGGFEVRSVDPANGFNIRCVVK